MEDYLNTVSNDYSCYLKLVHLNAQSLCNDSHYSEFCSSFANRNIDIIAVSETFFKINSNKKLQNYNEFTTDRNHSTASGGVALYIKDSYKTKHLASSQGVYGKPEYIIVEVLINSVKILCACVYRPPQVGFFHEFTNTLSDYISSYKYCFVCGDVNGRFGSGLPETQIISECFHEINLTFVPYGPTFHSGDSHSSLDVISSNCPELLIHSGQISAPGFSHHDLLCAVFSINTPKHKKKKITFRNFKNINIEAVLDDANLLPWENVYAYNDINNKITILNAYLEKLMDKHAPFKTINAKKHDEPWITVEMKLDIKKRDKLWEKYKKSGDRCVFEEFRKLRNASKQSRRNAKIRYMHQIFNASKDSKYLWSKVKSIGIGGRQNKSEPDIPINDLKTHYASVCTIKYEQEVENNIREYTLKCGNCYKNLFYFKYAYPEEVYMAVNNIKSDAIGADMLPLKFIKICLPVILPVLVHVFNYSLQNGVFPSLWKLANIIPVPKVSHPKSCKDYRPVSILCVLAKAFEKIVHNQITHFVDNSQIISKLQSGFRKGYGTITALLKVTNDIKLAMDKGSITLLSLLDLSKAFDCVQHELLIVKLKYLGFSESACRWLQSYLSNRHFRVYCHELLSSDWDTFITGVPQGSVLGPLLFNLYLYDVTKAINHSNFHIYADDVQLYTHTPTYQLSNTVTLMSEDITNLLKYFKAHNLVLNVEKTQAMILGTCKQLASLKETPFLSVQGNQIMYSREFKNLGVIFDSNLSWKAHCNLICNRMYATLAQLKRNLPYLPVHVKTLLVQSLMFPHIDYALPLLTGISQDTLLKVQRAQNAGMRFISNTSVTDHITPAYRAHNILKVDERRTMKIGLIIWKIMKFKSPTYMHEIFSPLIIYNRATRSCNKILKIPSHMSTTYNRSFVVEACRIFNKFKLSEVLHCSEYTVKNYLLSKI